MGVARLRCMTVPRPVAALFPICIEGFKVDIIQHVERRTNSEVGHWCSNNNCAWGSGRIKCIRDVARIERETDNRAIS